MNFLFNQNFIFEQCLLLSSDQNQSATLMDVLNLAGLYDAYEHYLVMFKQAEDFFQKLDDKSAFNIIHNIWMDPYIVPALLLAECFYARNLIVPTWHNKDKLYLQLKAKKTGGTRPILIVNKSTRICIGAVNSILQSSCSSWDKHTTGFRPTKGTYHAVDLLCTQIKTQLGSTNQAYMISFDLSKAFNSVNVNDMFKVLDLKSLPHSMKAHIWKWQNLPVTKVDTLQCKLPNTGLLQGFPYSPTLFSWYLDRLIGKDPKFIAYADNFIGVFPTKQEADYNFKLVQSKLAQAGLTVNQGSISRLVINTQSKPYMYTWLGLCISLPDCTVIPSNPGQSKKTPPTIITAEKWNSMLHKTDWVNKTMKSNWRLMH